MDREHSVVDAHDVDDRPIARVVRFTEPAVVREVLDDVRLKRQPG